MGSAQTLPAPFVNLSDSSLAVSLSQELPLFGEIWVKAIIRPTRQDRLGSIDCASLHPGSCIRFNQESNNYIGFNTLLIVTTQMDRLRMFADQQPVIRPADLERLAVPRNYLGRLVREGKLERVGRGL